MTIVGWVFGILLIFIGTVWCWWARTDRFLARREAEMMREHGKFDEEPEYMRDFRVTRAEYDVDSATKHIVLSLVCIAVGVAIIIALLL